MENVVPSTVTRFLERYDLSIKNVRADGVKTIKKNDTKRVVAAYHTETRRFWVKDPSKNGRNNNFRMISNQITSENDLRYCIEQAIILN